MRRLVLCLLLCVGLPGAALAEDLSRGVATGPRDRLRIELARGDVQVIPHEAPEIRVRARARGLGAAGVHFSLERDADGWVLASREDAWLAWLRSSPRVRVSVRVPRGLALDVSTAGRITTHERGVHVSFPARAEALAAR